MAADLVGQVGNRLGWADCFFLTTVWKFICGLDKYDIIWGALDNWTLCEHYQKKALTGCLASLGILGYFMRCSLMKQSSLMLVILVFLIDVTMEREVQNSASSPNDIDTRVPECSPHALTPLRQKLSDPKRCSILVSSLRIIGINSIVEKNKWCSLHLLTSLYD